MAYRSSLLYRNPGHYRPGIFDLTYRNSNPYQVKAQYRTGIDDPIGDVGSGVDSQTLSAVLTPADTGSGAEGTYPSISVTLEGGGPVLEWVTGITDSQSMGVASTDTGSGSETEISGISATSSDSINYWYGTQQGYRTDVAYQSAKQYRGVGSWLSISQTQADTGSGTDLTVSFDNAMSIAETSLFLEAAGIYLSQADTGAGAEALAAIGITVEEASAFLEALGDRALSVEELMDLAEDTGGAIGTVAGPLSLRVDLRYRTNRAGRFPGRMRSRR